MKESAVPPVGKGDQIHLYIYEYDTYEYTWYIIVDRGPDSNIDTNMNTRALFYSDI